MAQLTLNFLGELEVIRDGRVLDLPPSKKTRGLLAYLALNHRSFRREHLCELLWEIPDDPRGSLRWSLSKLRRLVDEEQHPRIVANRASVAFDASDVDIDVDSLHQLIHLGPENHSTQQLERTVARYRGNFLEGLELPNFPDFYSWSVAEREQVNRDLAVVLRVLINRFNTQPEQALGYARQLVGVSPYDEHARAALIRLLLNLERHQEAEQQYQLGLRLLEEVGAESQGILLQAWRSGSFHKTTASVNETLTPSASITSVPQTHALTSGENPLIGRDNELQCLQQLISQVNSDHRARFMLIRGEPGIGKSRLLAAATGLARQAGMIRFRASGFESEMIRPFALWSDALRRATGLATASVLEGTDHKARHQLFEDLSQRVKQETDKQPLIVIFDDIQWCDESSAAALHYVLRNNSQQPLLVMAAARESELRDNIAMQQAIRGLRHDHLFQDLRLGPLSSNALQQLIDTCAPGANSQRLSEASGGNPLLAIELARAESEGDSGASLHELIQERMARLDVDATELLHWAAVLAPRITVSSLERVSGLAPNPLQLALDTANQQGMLQPSEIGFRFSHDLIAQSVYEEISPLRRQVMHRRIATFLEADTALDLQLAADLAHHAAQSGDAALAARAMVQAGRLCLRFFANEEALNLAHRGLQFSANLADAERVRLTLEFSEIQLTAAPVEDWEAAISHYLSLAEQALDHGDLPHARLGYHLASYLRWIHGQWSDARRYTLQAERVTRGGKDEDHILGMAETAKCLALLERDLSQADAMLMEAHALATRTQVQCAPIPAAEGILRYYENRLDSAQELLEEARTRFKANGDRVNEFQCLEFLTMVDIEQNAYGAALKRCPALLSLGDKLRDGSEGPFARAVEAFCRYALEAEETQSSLQTCLEALRLADAKQRLAYLLNRTALIALTRGDLDFAHSCAREALDYAELLQRNSDQILAHGVLARVTRQLDQGENYQNHLQALTELNKKTVVKWARDRAESLISPLH